MNVRHLRLTSALIAWAFTPWITAAQVDSVRAVPEITSPVEGAEIVEKLGQRIPIEDIVFIDENGSERTLAELMLPGKPVILNPGYYDCPKLCGLVTNGLLASMQETQWNAGTEYQVLTISLDPNESYQLAAKKRANYLKKLNREGADKGWHFLTGSSENIDKLIESTGFGFVWDEKSEQYIHAAAILFMSPDGVITRYMYGIQFPEFQLRNALYEAADGKVGAPLERLVLYCFEYDPLSNSYVPVALNIMKLGGLVTMLGLGIFLGLFWYRERRSKRTSESFT